MEGNNHNQCQVCGSGNGRCGSCGNMCGFGRHHLLRWFLGILIITWIFSIGMKFGEIKAQLNSYGYGNHYRAMPMMGGAWGNTDAVYYTQSAQTVPAMMTGSVKVIKQ